ncbi:hypothetical protein CDL15_Pgr028636 [Punica granatum]|nr:hypothetical protein CDL15_Pgr028636 [Punica granatum]
MTQPIQCHPELDLERADPDAWPSPAQQFPSVAQRLPCGPTPARPAQFAAPVPSSRSALFRPPPARFDRPISGLNRD